MTALSTLYYEYLFAPTVGFHHGSARHKAWLVSCAC